MSSQRSTLATGVNFSKQSLSIASSLILPMHIFMRQVFFTLSDFRRTHMCSYSKKISILCLISFLASFIIGCSKYTLISQKYNTFSLFKQERVQIYINKFVDSRPREEKKGLTKQTKKILSFATKDSDFKEKIDEAVTKRIKFKLEEEGFYADISTVNSSEKKSYILEGEIKHFQVTMRLPNTTFVPYLGTAATIITKDEFNVAMSITATLKDAENNKILFSQLFDVSEDVNVPTGPLNLDRFKRGVNYRLKLLDEALAKVIEQMAQKINTALVQENSI